MINKFLLISLVVVFLIVGGTTLFEQLSIMSKNPPSSKSSNFNLIFKYGVGAKNELNTFDQTYTKDMVTEPPLTTKFKLSDNELGGIYKKIKELKLFDEEKKPKTGSETEMNRIPCSSYYLEVQTGSILKELSWDDCHGKVSDKLQQFTSFITLIIESKEEYKKLPTPKSAYY